MININDIKKEFDIFENNKDLVYLDSGATSLKPKRVLNKMDEYYEKYGVNIHRGVYELSYLATLEYEKAREKVARFINCKPEEVVFTKNVSEGLNQICLMLGELLGDDYDVLTTELEHHSSFLPWQHLSKSKNINVNFIELSDSGRITYQNFLKALTLNAKVLAITYVSNVMGYITDIKPIIEECHKKGIIVILDAAQAVQHFEIDVKDLDCDFLAFSGHKMFGPTGIGAFYGKYELLKQLDPVYYGGDMNAEVSKDETILKEIPYRFETGTPAIAEIIGLGEAIDFIEEIGFNAIKAKEKELRDYLFKQIKDVKGITVYNVDSDEAILLYNINGVHPHDAASFYDEAHICVRAGHHCAQLVSKWLGVDGTLRASLYIYNTKEDIDKFIEVTKYIVGFFNEALGE